MTRTQGEGGQAGRKPDRPTYLKRGLAEERKSVKKEGRKGVGGRLTANPKSTG